MIARLVLLFAIPVLALGQDADPKGRRGPKNTTTTIAGMTQR